MQHNTRATHSRYYMTHGLTRTWHVHAFKHILPCTYAPAGPGQGCICVEPRTQKTQKKRRNRQPTKHALSHRKSHAAHANVQKTRHRAVQLHRNTQLLLCCIQPPPISVHTPQVAAHHGRLARRLGDASQQRTLGSISFALVELSRGQVRAHPCTRPQDEQNRGTPETRPSIRPTDGEQVNTRTPAHDTARHDPRMTHTQWHPPRCR